MASIDELRGAAGRHLGWTGWVEIAREHMDSFAAATGASSPEYFVLAVTNLFFPELLEVRGISMGVNYGTGPVRFGPAVAAGDRVRAEAVVLDVEDVTGGAQATIRMTVHVEGADDPACVVDAVSRYLA